MPTYRTAADTVARGLFRDAFVRDTAKARLRLRANPFVGWYLSRVTLDRGSKGGGP